QVRRGANDVGDAMLTAFTSGEVWAVDVDSGQAGAVFPGLNITRFSLARDGRRIAFTTADSDGSHMWVAALDRSSSPRKLPVTSSPDVPRFAGEYIYYVGRERASEGGLNSVVRRIRVDGSGDESVWTKDVRRGAVAPTGRYLALTTRGLAGSAGDVIVTEIVDWQSGNAIPICRDCSGWWSDDGAWFIVARQDRLGDQLGLYLLPTRGDAELP